MRIKNPLLKGASLIVLILSLILAGCSSSTSKEKNNKEQSDKPIVIGVGYIGPEDHSYAKGIDAFIKKVEKDTNGKVKFEVFGNGQLGGEREMAEQVQLGTLDLMIVTAGPLGNFVPELSVLEMPFLFKSLDHVYKTLDGDIGKELTEKIDQAGFKTLGLWENGLRHITNDKKVVHSPKDLKGMKLRTLENDIYIETYKALGADATPIAFPEVYTSLQQGVIDGMDVSYGVFTTTKLYEVQNHLTENMLYYSTAPVIMNIDKFNSLPKDVQDVFVNAGKEITDVQRKINQDMEAEQKKFIAENGVEILKPSTEEMKAFREAVQPVYKKVGGRFGDMIERIQELEK
ncbi:TRAP transporter substrate-binding protein DctP [Bacillus massiliigorillae]|uniref:TRAP transporter substrate-binding protein DctP n=1 Tax=Bacillus massiliigorillae TaxID=1243664 RepID=UPI0003A54FE2|nr:TRAP transporter substrate-binding protein DctP [Bacillus massiliigorillae]